MRQPVHREVHGDVGFGIETVCRQDTGTGWTGGDAVMYEYLVVGNAGADERHVATGTRHPSRNGDKAYGQEVHRAARRNVKAVRRIVAVGDCTIRTTYGLTCSATSS